LNILASIFRLLANSAAVTPPLDDALDADAVDPEAAVAAAVVVQLSSFAGSFFAA